MGKKNSLRDALVRFASGKFWKESDDDYDLLWETAENNLKMILEKNGQKFTLETAEELVPSCITQIYEHLNRNGVDSIQDPGGYYYKICRGVVYQQLYVQRHPEHSYFVKKFDESVKKLETSGKIHSNKERMASNAEKLKILSASDLETLPLLAARFETKLLISEERWNEKRVSELEQLMLFILNNISGSITVNELKKCISERIYITQQDPVSLFEENEFGEQEISAKIVGLSDVSEMSAEENAIFEQAREAIIAKVSEIASKGRSSVKILKAWHAYTILGKTLDETAELFGYAAPSSAEYAVKHKQMKELSRFMSLKLLGVTDDDVLLRIMAGRIFVDLDRIISGLNEGTDYYEK